LRGAVGGSAPLKTVVLGPPSASVSTQTRRRKRAPSLLRRASNDSSSHRTSTEIAEACVGCGNRIDRGRRCAAGVMVWRVERIRTSSPRRPWRYAASESAAACRSGRVSIFQVLCEFSARSDSAAAGGSASQAPAERRCFQSGMFRSVMRPMAAQSLPVVVGTETRRPPRLSEVARMPVGLNSPPLPSSQVPPGDCNNGGYF